MKHKLMTSLHLFCVALWIWTNVGCMCENSTSRVFVYSLRRLGSYPYRLNI